MRRNDIKVGEDYLYNNRADWQAGGGDRVTVLDARPWAKPQGYYGSRKQTEFTMPDGTVRNVNAIQRPGGAGVLVKQASKYSDGGYEVVVVPIAQLRGPWEEANAAVEERKRADAAAYARKATAGQLAKDKVTQLAARAEALLGHRTYLYTANDNTNVSGLRIADFEQLLELAEQAQWHKA